MAIKKRDTASQESYITQLKENEEEAHRLEFMEQLAETQEALAYPASANDIHDDENQLFGELEQMVAREDASPATSVVETSVTTLAQDKEKLPPLEDALMQQQLQSSEAKEIALTKQLGQLEIASLSSRASRVD